MGVVAHWIASAVLHVADEHIMPVGDIERAVGGKLHRDRTEITVLGLQQVLPESQFVACAVFRDSVLLRAEEADSVVDNQIALNVIGEMAAADEVQAGGWTDLLGIRNEVRWQRSKFTKRYPQGRWGHPADIGIRGIRKEVLAISIEGNAPRIRNTHAQGAFKLLTLRGVTEEATVGAPLHAIRRFDVAMEERPFGHVERARRVGPEGADGVVRIMVVEPAKDDLRAIGLTVAIEVT